MDHFGNDERYGAEAEKNMAGEEILEDYLKKKNRASCEREFAMFMISLDRNRSSEIPIKIEDEGGFYFARVRLSDDEKPMNILLLDSVPSLLDDIRIRPTLNDIESSLFFPMRKDTAIGQELIGMKTKETKNCSIGQITLEHIYSPSFALKMVHFAVSKKDHLAKIITDAGIGRRAG